MEGQERMISAILDEEADDFDTMDLEGELVGLENELVGLDLQDNPLQNVGGDVNSANQEPDSKQNKRRKKKKKKPRKKKGSQGPDEINIDRFVLDACRRLRERKTHLVYTAVGYLGVAALRDLIKETLVNMGLFPSESVSIAVDAIQTCGGQKIANGKRFRNGGGILWNILKTRDPNAYREIMKKTREFENQFRQQNKVQKKEVHPESVHPEPISENFLDHRPVEILEEKRAPVRDRIRVPVTYDDLLDVEGPEIHAST